MTTSKKPIGWKSESYRHFLASKGVKTKNVRICDSKHLLVAKGINSNSSFYFSYKPMNSEEQKKFAIEKMHDQRIMLKRHIDELKIAREEAQLNNHIEQEKKLNEDIFGTNKVIKYLDAVEKHAKDENQYMASKYGGQRFAYARNEESAGSRPSKDELDRIMSGNTVVATAVNKYGQKDRVELRVLAVRGNRITAEFITFGPAVTTQARKVFLRKGQVLQIRNT
jgi:hypothetical protein